MGYFSKHEDENQGRDGDAVPRRHDPKREERAGAKGRRTKRTSDPLDGQIDFRHFAKLLHALRQAQKACDNVPQLSAKNISGGGRSDWVESFLPAHNAHVRALKAIDDFLAEHVERLQPGDYRDAMANFHAAVKRNL